MLIEANYATKEEVPEKFAELYTESEGKYQFSGIKDFKMQSDVDAVKTALNSERGITTDLNKQLKAFDGIDPVVFKTNQDRLAELELAGTGKKIDDEGINKIVDGRVKSQIGPIEQARDSYKLQFEDANGKVDVLNNEKRVNKITSELQKVATDKLKKEAIPDALMYAGLFEVSEDGKVITKDGCGVTPGISVEAFITEKMKTSPHWVEPSNGAGAGARSNTGVTTSNDAGSFTDIMKDSFAKVK